MQFSADLWKLLNWLEALSLMERMTDAIRTVSIVKELVSVPPSSTT